LTLKPKIIVCNTDEASVANGNKYTQKVIELNKDKEIVLISAEIEQQINDLNESDAKEFMQEIGLKETGLDRLIKSSYKSLDLCTYFTAGPQETRAWTVKKNSKAPDAAAVIHTDFKKGFIKAEVIAYEEYIKFNGEIGCRDNGKLRIEGKEYQVKDGDILHFRFNT
jgi:ribosome-binding ATPase YchF (GTP1/OBG family)